MHTDAYSVVANNEAAHEQTCVSLKSWCPKSLRMASYVFLDCIDSPEHLDLSIEIMTLLYKVLIHAHVHFSFFIMKQ